MVCWLTLHTIYSIAPPFPLPFLVNWRESEKQQNNLSVRKSDIVQGHSIFSALPKVDTLMQLFCLNFQSTHYLTIITPNVAHTRKTSTINVLTSILLFLFTFPIFLCIKILCFFKHYNYSGYLLNTHLKKMACLNNTNEVTIRSQFKSLFFGPCFYSAQSSSKPVAPDSVAVISTVHDNELDIFKNKKYTIN